MIPISRPYLKVYLPDKISRLPALRFSLPNPKLSVISAKAIHHHIDVHESKMRSQSLESQVVMVPSLHAPINSGQRLYALEAPHTSRRAPRISYPCGQVDRVVCFLVRVLSLRTVVRCSLKGQSQFERRWECVVKERRYLITFIDRTIITWHTDSDQGAYALTHVAEASPSPGQRLRFRQGSEKFCRKR